MKFLVIDLLIVLMCVGASLRGKKIGFIRQLGSTMGFGLGLYAGSFVSNATMEQLSGVSQLYAGMAVLLAVAYIGMVVGELLAFRLKLRVKNAHLNTGDEALGAIASVGTLVLGIWLTAAFFMLASNNSVQAYIKNSRIISTLNQSLPPPTQLLARLNSLVDPNASPQVFAGREPAPDLHNALPNPVDHTTMLAKARASVVKIEGLGCGGLADGSGFIYAPRRVVTNAHVVAGLSSPKVSDGSTVYNTTVVVFDPMNDLAVLYVPDLEAPALRVQEPVPRNGASLFVVGFPGGGQYQERGGVLLETITALGRDIYGSSKSTRQVLSLQAQIVPGNSGGPVLNTSGAVVGVVFATSTTYNNVGYALTASQARNTLTAGTRATQPVSTGVCNQKGAS